MTDHGAAAVFFDAVAEPVITPDVNAELGKYKGRWVAVDETHTRIIAVGSSAVESMAMEFLATVSIAAIALLLSDGKRDPTGLSLTWPYESITPRVR